MGGFTANLQLSGHCARSRRREAARTRPQRAARTSHQSLRGHFCNISESLRTPSKCVPALHAYVKLFGPIVLLRENVVQLVACDRRAASTSHAPLVIMNVLSIACINSPSH